MRKYIAEIIGTFAMMFCGTGAIIIDQQTNGAISHLGISITFGLIVMAVIYALGHISGAHLNPAVSIAFTLAGKLEVKQLTAYILSQMIGAFLASLLLCYLSPENKFLGATLPSGTILQSFILEFIITFILMLVIISVATGGKEKGIFAGLVIGLTVLLMALFAGPICGASMNPARSIAPAVVSGHTEHLWIYIVAPILGAASAIPTWKFLIYKEHKIEHE